MGYLIGKRVEYLYERDPAETKSGVIVSEPFREPSEFASDGQMPREWATYVVVLWEDGRMEGAVDIEELKVIEE
jgi:hypothetical protein